ncbi:MAG TPA: Hsp20/alpha crystallin family protein [Verrucomicrobiae bacterium]|jgi:HSP20 family molecular chaperone IbpA
MSPGRNPLWVPNVNVLVNAAGELIIKAELAGLTKENLEITVEGQRLTFTGHRPDPDGEGAQHLVLEMHHGRFESVVEVPESFDLSRAQAAYQNGILRIVAPRRTSTT